MKEIYAWVPWFAELSHKIDKGGRKYLAERAEKVRWNPDGKQPPLFAYGDENIDPFSFLCFLSSKNKEHSIFPSAFSGVSKVFELKTPDWNQAQYFPTGNPLNVLFHKDGKGDPDTLWKLFSDAVRAPRNVKREDFEATLQIDRVGLAKLTQTLFLINPHEFLPWDKWQRQLGIHELPAQPTWEEYKQGIDKVRTVFPGCDLQEISLFSYLQGQEQLVGPSSGFFQIPSAPEDEGQDRWADDFNPNNWVYTLRSAAHLEDTPPRTDKEHLSHYPLKRPKRGDILLVRNGQDVWETRALGVVYENDYAKSLVRRSRIHVLWINKTTASISLDNPEKARFSSWGFGRAGHYTSEALRRVDEYAPTLRLLEKLGVGAGKLPGNGPLPDERIEHMRNRILYGPPGTGKTWSTVHHALAIIDDVKMEDVEGVAENQKRARFKLKHNEGQIEMVTFHQNFSYEDFVEGIRPKLYGKDDGEDLGYELRAGIFKLIVFAALEHPDKRFVLIIDEINRGNIAKIFGELITLIEDSRRWGAKDETFVILPYSQEPFAVPDNLYIIGTMNTADRSIQLLDTALRRRFIFIEMMPNPDHELIPADVDGVDCREMLKVMNRRITILLDREHQIGHTYLLELDGMDALAETFRNRIFPLLQEYFFDDWAKIRVVLGNNSFVQERDIDPYVAKRETEHADSKVYQRLPDSDSKWLDPSEYRKIYETSAETSDPNTTAES